MAQMQGSMFNNSFTLTKNSCQTFSTKLKHRALSIKLSISKSQQINVGIYTHKSK